ncbi:MAG TPA: MBL fold metallo-hydrolase [Aggregatilineaceae bacterium]|nr:MBL fold metallo-hydrolase [Aggregatilineaceae bacterium]
MTLEIIPVITPFILRTTVNCYLVRTDSGFVLIDTARTGKRREIEDRLDSANCKPGNLKLIVLTHGDFDHCGNAAFLREKYGAQVTMHEADHGMVERGDMFWNRKTPNILVKTLMRLLFRLSKADRFKPDFYIKEGDNLSEYGVDAEVIEIPGHSKGSIALLTADGDLFCGDLLANVSQPDVWSIIDDPEAAKASVEKLKGMEINMVYPGHGQPFPMRALLENSKTSASTDAANHSA